nr:PREDICTED: uncharacterized protein LOC105670174 [Linepithema humile]
MEDKNLSEKKVESVPNEISENKQNMSKKAISLYSDSYTQTRLQSNIFNYTWIIEGFDNIFKTCSVLISPPFPEIAQYQIKVKFEKIENSEIQFYIVTEQKFTGSCSILLEDLSAMSCETLNDTKSFMIFEEKDNYINAHRLDDLSSIPKQIKIKCVLEVFQKILSDSIHTPLSSTNLKIENSSPIRDSNSKEDTKLIKFMISGISYSVSKHILYTTKSNFFKTFLQNIQIKNEIKIEEFQSNYFKTVLTYIQTGLVQFPEEHMTYSELLKNAYKYDVQNLKLICEQYLLREVTYQTAVEFMKLALICDAKLLAEYAASVIKFYYEKIAYTKEFQLLQQEYSDKINELIEKSKILQTSEDFL